MGTGCYVTIAKSRWDLWGLDIQRVRLHGSFWRLFPGGKQNFSVMEPKILFVRSRFRHYQLELVARRCLSASRVPSMLWDGGARQDGSVVLPLDRGLTGVGSTENTSYVLTSDGGRWGDAQIFPRQTFVHFCLHRSSPLALHLWEPSWLVWSRGYDPSDLRSDSSGFCLAAR